MKKILISTLTLIMMFSLTVFVQATEFSATYTAEVDFTDMDPTLSHDSPRVEKVISCNMVVKPKTKAHLSRLCSSAIAKVKYYFNSSSSDIRTGADYQDIVTDEFFYPSSGRISNSYIGGTISYKVTGDFQTKKTSGEVISLEVPSDYQQAVIISSITKQVDLGVATTVSVETGDQSQPNWTGTSGAFPGLEGMLVDWTYNFGFLDDSASSVSGVSKVSFVKKDIIMLKGGLFDSSINGGHILFSPGAPTETVLNDELRKICLAAKRLVVQYNEAENACDSLGNILITTGWNELVGEDLNKFKVKSDGNISYPAFLNAWVKVSAMVGEPSENDYRPARRTIVKSRIGTKYPGFEFKNLKEGDSVKIYSVNGKKIKEISSGTSEGFVWNGKKDNGDWAKSGIYVYQIKVDGKTISGTIVFVY